MKIFISSLTWFHFDEPKCRALIHFSNKQNPYIQLVYYKLDIILINLYFVVHNVLNGVGFLLAYYN